METKSNASGRDTGVAQLNALIVLVNEILVQVSKEEASAVSAREKAASILTADEMSQERVAKILSMQKAKVAAASKRLKI